MKPSLLNNLLKYAISYDSIMAKDLAILIVGYGKDPEALKLANSVLGESINIDLWELESLVNPDKFEFPDTDLGMIGVDLDEETSM